MLYLIYSIISIISDLILNFKNSLIYFIKLKKKKSRQNACTEEEIGTHFRNKY